MSSTHSQSLSVHLSGTGGPPVICRAKAAGAPPVPLDLQTRRSAIRGSRLRILALATAAGLAACMADAGCSSAPKVVKINAPLARSPQADEATRVRDWQPSVCSYQSGAVTAWPTRWYYAPNPDYTDRSNYVLDPLMSVVQAASLPVTLILEPPFARKVIYAGDVPPPSYNGMPPLPPVPAIPVGNPYPDPLAMPKQRHKSPPLP
ncbi:MAG TPA: hypothetical protein VFC78_06575, partial [Tepidisphaeraceae bacterium]|nr:hypothetical protein [Tepidisphaeraceae bacterium]